MECHDGGDHPRIIGFFVIPVIGMPIGFVVGVYAAEWYRLRSTREGMGPNKVRSQRCAFVDPH